jgi:hypothetical protein
LSLEVKNLRTNRETEEKIFHLSWSIEGYMENTSSQPCCLIALLG